MIIKYVDSAYIFPVRNPIIKNICWFLLLLLLLLLLLIIIIIIIIIINIIIIIIIKIQSAILNSDIPIFISKPFIVSRLLLGNNSQNNLDVHTRAHKQTYTHKYAYTHTRVHTYIHTYIHTRIFCWAYIEDIECIFI